MVLKVMLSLAACLTVCLAHSLERPRTSVKGRKIAADTIKTLAQPRHRVARVIDVTDLCRKSSNLSFLLEYWAWPRYGVFLVKGAIPAIAPTIANTGEVAEWSNVPDSKSGVGANPPWVRIPPSPPRVRLKAA